MPVPSAAQALDSVFPAFDDLFIFYFSLWNENFVEEIGSYILMYYKSFLWHG